MSSIVVKYSIVVNRQIGIRHIQSRSSSTHPEVKVWRTLPVPCLLIPLLRMWYSFSLGLFILNCTLIWTCGNTTHLSFVFIHSAPRTSYGTTLFANISHARLDSQISDAVQEKISSTV